MKEMYKHEMPSWLIALGAWRVNRDSIDFNWGYFCPKFGLEIMLHRGHYFDSTYRLSFCFGWGLFHIRLPFTTSIPQHCDWPSYGIQLYENQIWIRTGDCEQNQATRKMISWDIPIVSRVFDSHEVQRENGEWVKYLPEWDNPLVPDGRHIETHPYRYILKSGEVQERTATVYAERHNYHRKWLPFWKEARQSISVKFSDEVGERAGSWKGGCVGCGYDLLTGETMLECLRRMESERKFR